uniref:Uncharacterized protein n=1 Tax=viral metagenome TaxID=1070528 RepID=A0A6C0CTY4_9ZZZZ
MPKTLFRDNYYYELTSISLTIYKYDIYDENYIKIDQCYLKQLPRKYLDIISEFQAQEKIKIYSLEASLKNIKISV